MGAALGGADKPCPQDVAEGSTTPRLASFASPPLWALMSRFSSEPLIFSSNAESQSLFPTETSTACVEEDPRVAPTPLTAGVALLAEDFPVASVRENPDERLRGVAHHVLWGRGRVKSVAGF